MFPQYGLPPSLVCTKRLHNIQLEINWMSYKLIQLSHQLNSMVNRMRGREQINACISLLFTVPNFRRQLNIKFFFEYYIITFN